jgi:DNA polymerase V
MNTTKIKAITKASKKTGAGGKREGAGRPKGSGKYGEPTTAIRVPQSWAIEIKKMLKQKSQVKNIKSVSDICSVWRPGQIETQALPLYGNKIAAGFPSPADDHIESSLDLNEYLIEHPAATFYVRVSGESMIKAGINPNDILIVDRAVEPVDGKIVIAVLNGELTVKRLVTKQSKVFLYPENDAFKPIEVSPEAEFKIWGVVTNVIHRV